MLKECRYLKINFKTNFVYFFYLFFSFSKSKFKSKKKNNEFDLKADVNLLFAMKFIIKSNKLWHESCFFDWLCEKVCQKKFFFNSLYNIYIHTYKHTYIRACTCKCIWFARQQNLYFNEHKYGQFDIFFFFNLYYKTNK